MIRLVPAWALVLALAASATAARELPPEPDVSVLRSLPGIDLSVPVPWRLAEVVTLARDEDFFTAHPAPNRISRDIAGWLLLSSEPVVSRRLQLLNLQLEIGEHFTAQEVLTIYLQRVFLGRGCFGFPDALHHLAGTTAEQATRAELLTLAARMTAPALPSDNPLLAERYRSLVQRGAALGYWGRPEADLLAVAGPVDFGDRRCLERAR